MKNEQNLFSQFNAARTTERHEAPSLGKFLLVKAFCAVRCLTCALEAAMPHGASGYCLAMIQEKGYYEDYI